MKVSENNTDPILRNFLINSNNLVNRFFINNDRHESSERENNQKKIETSSEISQLELVMSQKPSSWFDLGLLGKIQKTLNSLHDLIPSGEGNLSVNGKTLNNLQISAYHQLKEKVDKFELELLIKKTLQEEKGGYYFQKLTKEDEDEIKNASSKENLEEIKKSIREKNSWNDFFKKHEIDEINKNSWKERFTNAEEAEKVYTEFDSVDFPLSSLSGNDKKKLLQGKTPNDLLEKKIEISWDQFFRSRNITSKENRESWSKGSGFNVRKAIKAWDVNGWTRKGGYWKIPTKQEIDSPDWTPEKLIDFVDSQVIKEVMKDVCFLEHKLSEVMKLINILDIIDNASQLNVNDLLAITINGYNYQDVPTKWSYDNVKKIKSKKQSEIFADFLTNFKKINPKLSANAQLISNWLTNDTGLAKNGIQEGEAYANGWKDPALIKWKERGDGSIFSYVEHSVFIIEDGIGKETRNVSVTFNRDSIDFASNLLEDISKKSLLSELPKEYRQAEIESLDDDKKLPNILQKMFTNF